MLAVLLLDSGSLVSRGRQLTLIALITKPLHSCSLFHYTSKKLTNTATDGECPRPAEKGGEMSVGDISGGKCPRANVQGECPAPLKSEQPASK